MNESVQERTPNKKKKKKVAMTVFFIAKNAAEGIEPAQDTSVRQDIGAKLYQIEEPWLLGVCNRTERLLHHLLDCILRDRFHNRKRTRKVVSVRVG